MLVANEQIEVFVTLRNPFAFPMNIKDMSIMYVLHSFLVSPHEKLLRPSQADKQTNTHIEHPAPPSTPNHTKYPSLPYLSKLSASPPWRPARVLFKSGVSPFVSRTVLPQTFTFPFWTIRNVKRGNDSVKRNEYDVEMRNGQEWTGGPRGRKKL